MLQIHNEDLHAHRPRGKLANSGEAKLKLDFQCFRKMLRISKRRLIPHQDGSTHSFIEARGEPEGKLRRPSGGALAKSGHHFHASHASPYPIRYPAPTLQKSLLSTMALLNLTSQGGEKPAEAAKFFPHCSLLPTLFQALCRSIWKPIYQSRQAVIILS